MTLCTLHSSCCPWLWVVCPLLEATLCSLCPLWPLSTAFHPPLAESERPSWWLRGQNSTVTSRPGGVFHALQLPPPTPQSNNNCLRGTNNRTHVCASIPIHTVDLANIDLCRFKSTICRVDKIERFFDILLNNTQLREVTLPPTKLFLQRGWVGGVQGLGRRPKKKDLFVGGGGGCP